MNLTAKQRSYLKSLGHHLTPILSVGHQGVTPELTAEVSRALETHELIKVKLQEHAPGERHALAEALATSLDATVAQVIGRIVLLYRRREKDPAIKLP